MILASFKPPDMLDLPDAFGFWIVRVILLLAAALGAWLAFEIISRDEEVCGSHWELTTEN
jgi:hypothetical protein